MKFLLLFFSVLVLVAWVTPSHAAQGIALWGEPKYPDNFKHFEYVNPAAPKGGTMKLSYSATFDSMNPFILKGVAAPGVAGYVYQSLMTPSYDEPQSYYALIAKDIRLAPDRSYADFTLNENARWHDGKPVTVEDVVWSFEILKEKGHPSLKVQYKAITIEKRSAHHVRFHFADKNHRELPMIAASMPVLPKHYFCEGLETNAAANSGGKPSPLLSAEAQRAKGDAGEGLDGGAGSSTQASPHAPSPNPLPQGERASLVAPSYPAAACVAFDKTTLTPPLGSGPYRVSKVEPGRSITLDRVKDYWAEKLPTQKGMNNFDTIRFDVYRDDTVALEGIKSGQFDYYEEFIARNWATAYNIPAVESGELIKVKIPNKIPRGMQGFIFNTRLAKFSDARVREAIGLTLDYEWMNRVLFFDAYDRGKSFFGNTDFEALGLPSAAELALLNPYRCRGGEPSPLGGEGWVRGREESRATLDTPSSKPSPPRGEGFPPEPTCLPESLFTTEYKVPTTDGTGHARENLIRAQALLNEAGWVMKEGVRVNENTGEALEIEFLMTQKTFERVIAIMKHNLAKLGIKANFRYVDASQYQKRLEKKQFDMVSIWWNLGLFYPSTEQYLYWHSSQANLEGSQNLSGAKNPAIDTLVEKIQNAQKLEDLRPAARALDRVLTHGYYVIPHWNLSAWRVVYWDKFGRPDVTPAYNLGIDTWWQARPAADKEEK
jgi:ABC-type oligopeptide transport system substrate-binding subunit